MNESTDLDAGLGQVDSQCQLLAEEHVRVMCLVEGSLKLLQLEVAERRPVNQQQRNITK